MSSLTGGCSCNSSSSSNAFDIVLIILLKAVSEVNKNNNSYQSGDILDNIEAQLKDYDKRIDHIIIHINPYKS